MADGLQSISRLVARLDNIKGRKFTYRNYWHVCNMCVFTIGLLHYP